MPTTHPAMSEAMPVFVNHPKLQAEPEELPAPASELIILKKLASSIKSLVPSGLSCHISMVSLGNRTNKLLALPSSTLSNMSSQDVQPSCQEDPDMNPKSDMAPSEGILMFCSITIFIVAFQKIPVMRFTDLDKRSLNAEVQQELRTVTTLASILIRDHRVAAVVPLTRTVEGKELLQVLVLAHLTSNDADYLQLWSMQNHWYSTPPTIGEGDLRARVVNGKMDYSFLQKSNLLVQFNDFRLEPVSCLF